ncbi:Metalloendopeptidase [Aphelenchoides bicaudatus]|nr:Metalloendopeptidase [Aphelenchoides bicaudatus]
MQFKCLSFVILFVNLTLAEDVEKENESKVKKRCRISGARTFSPNDIDDFEERYTQRTAHQDVYLWPSLTEQEKTVIRDAFYQIARRTCIKFNELDYKPWYHSDRWEYDRPYVVIRKSKKFTGYTDNRVEDVAQRSLLYLTDTALNGANFNHSRGLVMNQLLRFMGYREEYLRPDAVSYLRAVHDLPPKPTPNFSPEQLNWPFDPESISIPSPARLWFDLTVYCTARQRSEIGAGQRAGLLTRWDAVKLNSMYCPQKGYCCCKAI